MKKKENAITLISLVITIIVLIVLAGVAINLTFGQNGLITKAKQAKESYTLAKEREELELEITNVQVETWEKENRQATLQDLYEKIDQSKYEVEPNFDQTKPTELIYLVIKKIDSNNYFTVDKNLTIINEETKGTDKKNEQEEQEEQKVEFSEITWSNGKASIELTKTGNGIIEYKVGETENYKQYQEGQAIDNLKFGDVVYARCNNNGKYSKEEKKVIYDLIKPKEFEITTSNVTGGGFKITGSTTDNESGIKDYTYVVAKGDTIVKEITGQTATEYTITGLKGETEYIAYMIAYDNAGNQRKSNEVAVTTTIGPTDIYAKLYTDGTLTLASTNIRLEDKELQKEYEPITQESDTVSYIANISSVKKVKILDTIRPTWCYGWFNGASNLTNIENIENLDTRLVTNMRYMFGDCKALTSIDVSHFDTSNVTNMERMFYDCTTLTNIDISNFDTSNVTNMTYMFGGSTALENINLGNINTSKVAYMNCMFNNCQKLASIDLSHFNTSNVVDMNQMFSGCTALTSLDLRSFNTSKVTNMSSMFTYCEAITSIDLSSFDTSKVTNMSTMFARCEAITSLDLSSFDTSKVTNMTYMFAYSSKLTSIKVKNGLWKTASNSSNMFSGCGTQSLTTIN